MKNCGNSTPIVVTQSVLGIVPIGLFYGWAALTEQIAIAFHPEAPLAFQNQHGLFVGVLVLFLSACPLLSLLHVAITHYKIVSEFTVHALGLILIVIGLSFGCIALEYKQLWLWYLGCGLFCGIGELMVFRRVLFQHQMHFKSIGKAKLGGGLFGFIIGAWTIFFFLISEPFLARLRVGQVLAVYAGMMVPAVLYPLLTINDQLDQSVREVEERNDEGVDKVKSYRESDWHALEGDSRVIELIPATPSPPEKEIAPLQEQEQEQELTLVQLFCVPQSYILTVFFMVVLTPGWGIKLASIFILKTLFSVSLHYAEAVSVIYLASYACGRLFSGMLAEILGVRLTYFLVISIMTLLLFLLPHVSEASDKTIFVVLLCLVGLLYGGCKALFYSIVFDIFGARNYRVAFSFAHNGFGFAVVLGGISSAYSFSSNATIETGYIWFYSMGGLGILAMLLLAVMRPIAHYPKQGDDSLQAQQHEGSAVEYKAITAQA